jgi:hypothetical protein
MHVSFNFPKQYFQSSRKHTLEGVSVGSEKLSEKNLRRVLSGYALMRLSQQATAVTAVAALDHLRL